jgi:signal transduction histidine kinase
MKKTMSIRTKFLGVTGVLLLTCIAVFMVIAIKTFKEDKIALVYDLTRSQVHNLSSEIESALNSVSLQFRVFALLSQKNSQISLQDIFTRDGDVVYAKVERVSDGFEMKSYVNSSYVETYALKNTFFTEQKLQELVPKSSIQRNGSAVWAAHLSEAPPLLGFGRFVVVEDQLGRPLEQWLVYGYIKLDRWVQAMKSASGSEVFLASLDGQLLLQGQKSSNQRIDPKQSPFFKMAQDSKTKSSITHYEKLFGGFAKSFNNSILVISETHEDKVFASLNDFVVRALLFAGFIATLSFLAAVILSRNLTNPILDLVDGMTQVSQGNMKIQVPITSRDETAFLASTFNVMIQDLERSRTELEELNRVLDLKVKERTLEVEEKSRKISEIQEALIKTTRLAAAGEIAGRAAHEVLNPLTALLGKISDIKRSVREELAPMTKIFSKITQAWSADLKSGGAEHLWKSLAVPSKIDPQKSLLQEDLQNLEAISKNLEKEISQIEARHSDLMQEGQRIAKIVNGMRKMNHVYGERKVHSIHELLTEVLLVFEAQAKVAGVELVSMFHATQFQSDVDKDEFMQAVSNLIRNSLQAFSENSALESKSKRIEVRTSSQGRHLNIQIWDNGPGIAVENQSVLFKASFTTKGPEEGTGLGLGIARRFVRSWDGDMKFVFSSPEQGTLFEISLPLADDKKEVAA